MLTLTSPFRTPLDRLSAKFKLLLLALFTIVLFALSSPIWLTLAALSVILLHLFCGMRFARYAASLLLPIWPFVLLLAVWHGWHDDLEEGAVILLRMITAIAAANLVTLTTRLNQITEVFEWLFQPFSPVIPPKRLALAVALVIRFVPRFRELLFQLNQAWRARSSRRPGWRLMLPAIISALEDADRIAEALRARGGL